jgi:hypothetical protein
MDRGGGMIYDSTQNITWLQSASAAVTPHGGADIDSYTGTMHWTDAVARADNLVFGGHDDWRLPATPMFDSTCQYPTLNGGPGLQCTGSE